MDKLKLMKTANEVRKGNCDIGSQCESRTSGRITFRGGSIHLSVF